MRRTESVTVMLCCNSRRNGSFKGVLRAVVFGDELMQLDSPYIDAALRLDVARRRLTLGNARRSWPVLSYAEWVGNWCWNAVTMRPGEAADLLNFLLAFGYRPECGLSDWWGQIEAGELFTAADFELAAGTRG